MNKQNNPEICPYYEHQCRQSYQRCTIFQKFRHPDYLNCSLYKLNKEVENRTKIIDGLLKRLGDKEWITIN